MNLTRWLLLLILLLAVGLRFYKLDQVPSSLYTDELDLGIQARSLIATGHDYRGVLSPFFVRSFNSDRTPLPAYLTVVSTLLFSDPYYQVRGGAAFAGVATVLLAYWLAKLWTKDEKAALFVAFVFATSPWQLQFSRIAFEGTTMSMIVLLGLGWFFYWLKTKRLRDFYMAVILLSLSIYTYRTMSLFSPLLFVTLLVFYWRSILKVGWRNIFAGGLIAALMMGSFVFATTKASADQPRINQVSIFSDPLVSIGVMRNRERASGNYQNPTLGSSPVWWSRLVYNKPVTWLDKFGNNYLTAFSSQFLFISGDPNPRQGIGGSGVLLFADILGLGAALIFLYKNWDKVEYRFLATFILLSPLPSALTEDGGLHAHRLFIFALPLLILLGLGWWQLFEWLKKRRLLLGAVVLFWLASLSFYLVKYYTEYPYTSARWFGYGWQQAVGKISKLQDQYKGVALSSAVEPPVGYYWFWANVPARQLQAYGTDFSVFRPEAGPLGKVEILNWPEQPAEPLADNFQPGVLYLVTTRELPMDLRDDKPVPPGLKLLDIIKFPDNEVAFYLIARE